MIVPVVKIRDFLPPYMSSRGIDSAEDFIRCFTSKLVSIVDITNEDPIVEELTTVGSFALPLDMPADMHFNPDLIAWIIAEMHMRGYREFTYTIGNALLFNFGKDATDSRAMINSARKKIMASIHDIIFRAIPTPIKFKGKNSVAISSAWVDTHGRITLKAVLPISVLLTELLSIGIVVYGSVFACGPFIVSITPWENTVDVHRLYIY